MSQYVRIRLITGPFEHYLRQEISRINKVKTDLFATIGPVGIGILAEEAPKKTGALAQGFRFEQTGDRLWWYNVAETKDGIPLDLLIDNSDGGAARTTASPGRYVPAIDRRLVNTSLSSRRQVYKEALARGFSKVAARAALLTPIKRVPTMPKSERGGNALGAYYGGKSKVKGISGAATIRGGVKGIKGRGTGLIVMRNNLDSAKTGMVERHELFHAVQWKAGQPWVGTKHAPSREIKIEIEAADVAQTAAKQERDIGMHPGAKRTPFYERGYQRIKQWANQFIDERLKR